MALFDNIEDVVDLIAPIFGRLEEDDDPARKAIEDPSSKEAAILGSLLLGSKGPKVVEAVVDDPVGKARRIKQIGMRDIPTTATELPPEIPKEARKAKPNIYEKLVSGDAPDMLEAPEPKARAKAKVRPSVAELRGGVDETGFIDKMDDFTKGKKFSKAELLKDPRFTKAVAKEGGEEAVKKGLGGKAWELAKKNKGKTALGILGLALLYRNIFGDKKEKTPVFKPETKTKKVETRKAQAVDPRMESFKKFSEELERELETMRSL